MKTVYKITILAVILVLLSGCYHGKVDWDKKTVTRTTLFTETTIESLDIDTTTGIIKLRGYDAKEAKALELLRQAADLIK